MAGDWRAWVVDRFFGDLVADRVREASIFADEDRGWRPAGGMPRDVPHSEISEQIGESGEAYRQNALAHRVIELTTDYVLGRGLRLRASDADAQAFVDAWWTHPRNQMATRQFDLCTELSLAGELFITLHTNPYDGVTYPRAIPAAAIDLIESDPDDLETERRFHQIGTDGGRWWEADDVRHYAINRLIGTTRGQGDLVPLLPWLRRYREWLTDRVRINRFKGAFIWDVEVKSADRRAILARQAELATPPTPGSIIVHNDAERWTAVQPNINAADAEPDGRAMRLMIAAGAGLPLHYLAEAEGSNRATAAEMGGPTLRHFERRQLYVGWMFADLALEAARRSGRFAGRTIDIEAEFEDLSGRENAATASATRSIVEALATASERGWIDDETARRMIGKYAGETVPSGEGQAGGSGARVTGRIVVRRTGQG